MTAFIDIDGQQFAVEIDGDDMGNTIQVLGGGQCPTCKGETDWDVEYRGYCDENAVAICICGAEWPVKYGERVACDGCCSLGGNPDKVFCDGSCDQFAEVR